LGLTVDDLDDTVEVFPDIWPAFALMAAMGTQWRVGMGGATGLDYGVIREVGSVIGMTKKQISKAFPDLQVMEAEALAVMAEARQTSP
jgi:hypothetical protein